MTIKAIGFQFASILVGHWLSFFGVLVSELWAVAGTGCSTCHWFLSFWYVATRRHWQIAKPSIGVLDDPSYIRSVCHIRVCLV